MKCTLIYFSGTGNTERISRELAADLENRGWECSLVTVEKILSGADPFLPGDVIGVGFPIYKLTYPEIFEGLFPLLAKSAEGMERTVPSFVYSTYCRFPGSGLRRMARELERIGIPPLAARAFKAPSNGIASLKDAGDFEYSSVMYFEHRIDLSISEFASSIAEGRRTRHRGGFADGLKIALVDRIEKSRYPSISVDPELCIRCGACVSGCPEGNLAGKDGGIEAIDPSGCLHCLRCLHRCPKMAITFGPLVHGPNRYTKNTRDVLYAEAVRTPRESPEAGTAAVKRRWALGNLRQWMFGPGRILQKKRSLRRNLA